MIIGIDASRAIKQHKTGVEWYARHVLENIIKIDTQNQFVLYVQSAPDEWLKNLSACPNVRVKYLRWPLRFFWTQGRLSWEMFRRAPEVLFIPASAMPVICPKNTVAVLHDVGFMAFPKAYGLGQRWYLRWSVRRAVRRARAIITISEFSKKEIIKYFQADISKILVTPLGYDKNLFNNQSQAEDEDILRSHHINRPYFLYVGRLETKKNILNLLKAFTRVNQDHQYQLVLAGTLGTGFAKIFNFIQQNNLVNDVIFTGYILEKNLPALYRQAKIFLFPSLYEGFGLPVLEAMACGTPVICSQTTALPETAGAAAQLINPDSIEQIATAIKNIADNEILSRQFVSKGLERVGGVSWEKCATQTHSLLVDFKPKL